MVVYIVYGFRWPRAGLSSQAPGIRAHIVSYNLLDAAPEYLQEPKTSKAVLQSLKRIDPNVPYHLPGLRLIEQYDPEDTSDAALSQPYAYVAANVTPIGDPDSKRILSLDLEEIISKGPDLLPVGVEALSRLRDFLAPGEKIGWWIVYNGDPERPFPKEEKEEEEEEADDEEGEEESGDIIEPETGEPSEESIPGGAAALELLTRDEERPPKVRGFREKLFRKRSPG